MALFKEIKCRHCGDKTAILSRVRLADEQYICNKCTSGIPSDLINKISEYDYDEFVKLREYMDVTNTELAKKFRESQRYQCIHLDSEHGIFYLDGMRPRIYFHLWDLTRFDLSFHPDEVKEGMFGTKVTGKIYLEIETTFPHFYKEEIIDHYAKASAQVKGLLSNKVTYENPKDMDDFLHYFMKAWQRCIDRAIEQWEHEHPEYNNARSAQYQESSTPSELQQAMALFMLDDLQNVTLDDIKAQRNRLIKTFHPDHGDSADTGYAQKINNAYEVLKSYLS